MSNEQLQAGLLASPEFVNSQGSSPEDWIRGLYRDVLGRAPAEAEVQLWLRTIASGATDTQVAYGFAASPEQEARQIAADYQQYLARSPEPGMVPVWIHAFENGASNAAISAAFLSSAEYFQRHGNDYAGWYRSAVEDAYGGVLVQDGWFHLNIQDSALRLTAELASLDGQLDWNDVIAIFREVELAGPVTATELQGLQQLVAASGNPGPLTIDSQPVTMPAAVWNLASKVVGDNPANAFFQGPGDLHVGSTSTQLEELVDKWLLGLDHPSAAASYAPVSGSLFGSAGPAYTDVWQGEVNDCYLLAGFADLAAHLPRAIENLFTYLGTGADGSNVWAVRFSIGGQPDYVTVDNLLPGSGSLYDHPALAADGSGYVSILWAPLLEKAFAQEFGGDAYANLDTSQAGLALAAILGLSMGWSTMDAASLASNVEQGAFVLVGTGASPGSPMVVPNHDYAVVSYNPSLPQPFTVFNPWGVNRGPFASQFAADAAFLNSNFTYFWTTG